MALTKVKAGNIILTTPAASSNDVTPATTQYVTTALANLADSAPSTLNTLNELAAALGDDANFSTTVTNSIATKLPLAGGTLTGDLTLQADGAEIFLKSADFDVARIIPRGSSGSNLDKGLFSLFDGGTEDIRIDTGGNSWIDTGNDLGIGTTTPGYKLHVNGTAHVVNTLTAGAIGIPSQGITLNQGFGSGVPTMTMLGTAANGRGGAILFQEQGAANTAAIYSTDGGTGNASYGGLTIATYQSDLRFATNGLASTRMLIASNGNVGINIPSSQGVTQPAINFEAWDGDGVTKLGVGNNAAYVQRYQTHATAPASLVIDKASGTQASPVKVNPGDDLGRIIFRGQTGSGLHEAASIQVEANTSNLVNNGADIPSDIYVKTTRDGGSGPIERFRIDYDGATWHRYNNHGRYTWVKRVVFTGGQTQNLKFHLAGGNVHGQVRVTISGDYSNVNANGSFEKVWGWGYNSSNTSGYGGQGNGSTIVDVGSTSNVMSFGSMSKINVSTVKIPITNTAASYSVICSIVVEITGEIQGLKYTSIS